MSRRALGATVIVAVAVGVAVPATAGPKKPPVSKTYEVLNPAPHPQGGTAPGNGCQDGVEGVSKDLETFKIPALGEFKVELTGFAGDWDLILLDKKSSKLLIESSSDNGTTNTGGSNEKFTFKKGKAGQEVVIVACNWAGGPEGTVKYTFTYK